MGRLLLTWLCLLGVRAASPVVAVAAEQAPPAGLLVSVSATAEALQPATPGAPAGGLVLAITLTNATGQDINGLEVRAPVPPQTQVADSWQGQPDQNQAAVEGQTVRWSGAEVKQGDRLPPFVYRVVPAPGADGATIFRDAT
ncbi:MAG: hypothetical protein ACRDJN_28375, partial [Chloroflexota bacterium]